MGLGGNLLSAGGRRGLGGTRFLVEGSLGHPNKVLERLLYDLSA